MTKQQAAETVRRYVDGVRFGQDIDFVVDEEHIVVDGNWVRVPLRPTYYPERLMPFYLFLADLNAEIVAKEKVNYVITTGEPLQEDPSDTQNVTALAAA